jgi:hypothetical protein
MHPDIPGLLAPRNVVKPPLKTARPTRAIACSGAVRQTRSGNAVALIMPPACCRRCECVRGSWRLSLQSTALRSGSRQTTAACGGRRRPRSCLPDSQSADRPTERTHLLCALVAGALGDQELLSDVDGVVEAQPHRNHLRQAPRSRA